MSVGYLCRAITKPKSQECVAVLIHGGIQQGDGHNWILCCIEISHGQILFAICNPTGPLKEDWVSGNNSICQS